MFEEYRGVNGAVYKVNKDRIARGGEGSIHFPKFLIIQ